MIDVAQRRTFSAQLARSAGADPERVDILTRQACRNTHGDLLAALRATELALERSGAADWLAMRTVLAGGSYELRATRGNGREFAIGIGWGNPQLLDGFPPAAGAASRPVLLRHQGGPVGRTTGHKFGQPWRLWIELESDELAESLAYGELSASPAFTIGNHKLSELSLVPAGRNRLTDIEVTIGRRPDDVPAHTTPRPPTGWERDGRLNRIRPAASPPAGMVQWRTFSGAHLAPAS